MPEFEGVEGEGGELEAFGDAGIDADGVVEVGDVAGVLGGVTTDDCFSGLVCGGVGEFLPLEVVHALVGGGAVGGDAGVDEDEVVGFVEVDAALLQELEVGFGDDGCEELAGFALAVAGEGIATAEAFPAREVEGGIFPCVEHELVVVAAEEDGIAGLADVDEAVENTGDIGAFVDVVAQKYEEVVLVGRDGGKEGVKGGEVAVDVANSEGAHCLGEFLTRKRTAWRVEYGGRGSAKPWGCGGI